MSRDIDLFKLRKWIGKAQGSAEPVATERSLRSQPRAQDAIVQMNLKVPSELKRRMRHLAARDDTNLAELLRRMVDLYEKEHGRLPEIRGAQR